jgi:hypothetical protein
MKLARIVTALGFTCCIVLARPVTADDAPAPTQGEAAQANNAHDLEQSARLKQGLDLATYDLWHVRGPADEHTVTPMHSSSRKDVIAATALNASGCAGMVGPRGCGAPVQQFGCA